MTPADIIAKCDEQIRLAGPGTIVTLFLRGRKAPPGDKVRLLGRSGPVGQFYSESGDGIVVGFPALALKAFAEKSEDVR